MSRSFSETLNGTQIGSTCQTSVSSVSLAVTRLPSDLFARLESPVIGADDPRVAETQVHFGGARLGGFHGGARELHVRLGVVGFLLADGATLRERFQPRDFAFRLRELGASARHLGLERRGLRLQRLRIDEEQLLSCLHPSALGEKALLEDAGDSRPHLDLLRARRLPDVFVSDGDRSRLQHLGRHRGRRKAVEASLRRATAAGDERGGGKCSGEQAHMRAWQGKRRRRA